MSKIQILIITFLLIICVGFTWAEETELVPAGTLRVTLAPSFGFQIQKWDGLDTAKVKALNIGLGFEYGVINWISAQILWVPGVNVWSSMDDYNNYGYLSDIYGGLKISLIGAASPVASEKIRLAVAGGIKIPQVSRDSSDWEADLHLWGSSLRLFFDYLFTPVFYLNAFAEGIYYPEQHYEGPNYTTRNVYHPLDLYFELEPRFKYLAGEKTILHFGLPLNLFFAPWINRNDPDAMESTLRLSVGMFFTASFSGCEVPFDLSLRYVAPVWGKFDQPIHRVTLLGRLYFKH